MVLSSLKENEKIKTTDQNVYSKFRKMSDIILDFLFNSFWIITKKKSCEQFHNFFLTIS